jgi:hypothetical protein
VAKHQFIVFASPVLKAESDELLRRLNKAQPSRKPLFRTCSTFGKLHAELGTNRDTDWLFMLAEWEDGFLRLGAEKRRPADLARDWKGTVDLTVWEVIRFGGRRRGRKPALTTFAKLLRAGQGTVVETEWGTHSSFPSP